MKYTSCLWVLTGLLLAGCGSKNSAKANEATLDELNRDLSVMVMHAGGRLPNTNEFNQFLAATGKNIPTPPPGKKIVLDRQAGKFVVQDQ